MALPVKKDFEYEYKKLTDFIMEYGDQIPWHEGWELSGTDTVRRKKVQSWPKRVRFAMHFDKNSALEIGKDIKLDEPALQKFAYLGYELKMIVEVYENGDAFLVSVNNIDLAYPTKIT